MCIAVFSDKGSMMPKKTILKRCFRKNSDGAGYAVWDKASKQWHITKGLMTWSAFWKSFNAHQFTKEDLVFIHFRIGTSGKRVKGKPAAECTHPFPVVDGFEDMMKLSVSSHKIAMHNGVCGPGKGDASDTMVAINNYLEPLIDWVKNPKIRDIIGDGLAIDRCRWIYAVGDKIYMDGSWNRDDDTGIHYSNDGWKPAIKKITNHNYSRHNYGAHGNYWDGWTNNTSTPVVIKQNPDVPISIFPKLRAEQYIICQGQFDWKIWTKDMDDIDSGTKKIDQVNDDGLQKMYNMEHKLMAICDKHGNLLWDNDNRPDVIPEGKTDEEEEFLADTMTAYYKNDKLHGYHCGMCNAISTQEELNAGECPICDGAGYDSEVICAVPVDGVLMCYQCEHCNSQFFELSDLDNGRCPLCYGGDASKHPEQTNIFQNREVSYICSKCTHVCTEDDMEDGWMCPACGIYINKDTDLNPESITLCPNCKDYQYLIDSDQRKYPNTNTECMNCGAIFDSDEPIDGIRFYNIDSVRRYRKERRAVAKGGK